jgi:TatD DNase family protein
MPTFIDSHCHLEPADFRQPAAPSIGPSGNGATAPDERGAVIARAGQAGVARLIAIGSGSGRAEIENALSLAHRYAHIVAAIGIHPHDAKNIEGDGGGAGPAELRPVAELAEEAGRLWRDIEAWARDPRVVAVGETGLDYHYNHSTPSAQRALFRRFVALSNAVGKPLSLHIRDAHDEALAIAGGEGDAARAARHGGVVHCFTGNLDEARRWLDRGFHISLSGIVTFKSAASLREVAAYVPRDRLLLETDSPYLAPVPLRGRRNEPANLPVTAAVVAALRGVPVERLADETTAACQGLFRPAAGEAWIDASTAPGIC